MYLCQAQRLDHDADVLFQPCAFSDLQDALTRYRELLPDSNAASILREDKSEWSSVIDHVNGIRPAYEARVRKSRGVFGRFWSELGLRAESLKPWLELIPDDHGLRTLRAGLMVILQARPRLFSVLEQEKN